MYDVLLSKSSQKFIVKQSADTKARIQEALEHITTNPTTHLNIKVLKGELASYYRYRVGDIRIIYRIYEAQEQVFVVTIGYRGDVYKGN